MVDYRLYRGRKQFIKSNGDGLQSVEPGMLQIKLDNYDGIYDPYNTSSVLYPHVEPGRFINVRTTTDSTHVLLHMDGDNNGTVFTDLSEKVWTAAGNAVTSTTMKKFGTASLMVPDSTAYIWTPAHDDFWLQDKDWTWECQLRMSAVGGGEQYTLFSQTVDANNMFLINYISDSEVWTPFGLRVFCATGGEVKWDYTFDWGGSNLPSPNTWYHVEVCRHGDEILAYVNGNRLLPSDYYAPTDPDGKAAAYINANMRIGGASGGTCYIDEVRFTKGEALHTGDYFTPPTAAYEDYWRDRFRGQIDSIENIGDIRNPQVLITAYDGLKELKNNTLSTEIITPDTDIDGNPESSTGKQIAYMTTAAEWPSIYGTSSIGTGNGIIPYCWANEKSAFETIEDIADAEAGLFCARADGSFMFRSREATTAVMTLDQSVMLKDILLTSPYKLLRNVAKIYVYDKSVPVTTAVKLWKLNDTPLVSTAAGLTVWGRFSYNGQECAGIDMVPPADTTDFKMNSKPDGTGIDRTDKWDVTTTYYGEASKNVITNVSAVNNHYCILLRNRGLPVVTDESTYRTFDYSGTAAKRILTIDNPFIQTSWQAEFFDSFIEQLVATTLRFPVFQLESRPAYQFGFDIFDKIHLTIAKYGINGDYLVGGIEERWLSDNGQAVLTTVYTEPDIIVERPPIIAPEVVG
jgi:hypothetical protein